MAAEVRFVDRELELSALREWCSATRATPLYVYGPEGCGKTRLLREFVGRFSEYFGRDGVALYVDALEERDLRGAVVPSPSVDAEAVREAVAEAVGHLGLPLGSAISRSISLVIDRVAERLYRRNLRGKYVLVCVDDVVRAIGVRSAERYVKWLYELMWRVSRDYGVSAVNFIIATSEGESRRLVARHRHALVRLLWNLGRGAFEELVEELRPPSWVDAQGLWLLLGGNPGKLIELACSFEWNLERLVGFYREKLVEVVREVRAAGLLECLRGVVEDPDALFHEATESMLRLERVLTRENLIAYKHWTTVGGQRVERDPEVGVGEYYAWQVPLYREVLRSVLGS